MDNEIEYFKLALLLITQNARENSHNDEKPYSAMEDEVFGNFHQKYSLAQHDKAEFFLERAIQVLNDDNVLVIVDDDYADRVVVFSDINYVTDYLADLELFQKYRSLETVRSRWLKSAIFNILNRVEVAIVDKPSEEDDESWQPLPIEREDEKYQSAIEAWEEALQTIEGDNGYAATEPEERNGIVETLRGGLKAVKDGTPSRESILKGAVTAFQYVAKKFTDSAMGVAAKKAFEAILLWLA